MRTRLSAIALVVFLFTATAIAGKSTALNASMLPQAAGTAAVTDDGSSLYANGVDRVQVYLGAGGKDVDLVTYSSKRGFHFHFDAAATAWQNSHLPQDSNAQVDFYGVNFFGPYVSQAIGTTAQVHGVIQFKSGSNTYQLDYPAMASKRLSANTWLLTTDPAEIGGFPGFTAGDQAGLSLVRKKGNVDYGSVNMPFHIQFTLQ
jgi:hypothetical protein